MLDVQSIVDGVDNTQNRVTSGILSLKSFNKSQLFTIPTHFNHRAYSKIQ